MTASQTRRSNVCESSVTDKMNDVLRLAAVRPSRSRKGGTNTSALPMQIDLAAQRDSLLPKLVSGGLRVDMRDT